MAKCKRVYASSDIYFPFELAQREDGMWFFRVYMFSSYAGKRTWSRWEYLGPLKKIAHSSPFYEDFGGRIKRCFYMHFIFGPRTFVLELNASSYIYKDNVKYRLPD